MASCLSGFFFFSSLSIFLSFFFPSVPFLLFFILYLLFWRESRQVGQLGRSQGSAPSPGLQTMYFAEVGAVIRHGRYSVVSCIFVFAPFVRGLWRKTPRIAHEPHELQL